jgi:Ca2+-binding EF-hand superfamily protein
MSSSDDTSSDEDLTDSNRALRVNDGEADAEIDEPVLATDWTVEAVPSTRSAVYRSASLGPSATTSSIPNGIEAHAFDWSKELSSVLFSDTIDPHVLNPILQSWDTDKLMFLYREATARQLEKLIKGWPEDRLREVFTHKWMGLRRLCHFMKKWDFMHVMDLLEHCPRQTVADVITRLYFEEGHWPSDYVAHLLERLSPDKVRHILHDDGGGYEAKEAAKIMMHWSDSFIASVFKDFAHPSWLAISLEEARTLRDEEGWAGLAGGAQTEEEVRASFNAIDVDESGYLDHEELLVALRLHHSDVTQDQVNHMIETAHGIDEDGHGVVNFEEFKVLLSKIGRKRREATAKRSWTHALGHLARLPSLDELRAKFEEMDLDNSGELDVGEIMALLKSEGHRVRRHLSRGLESAAPPPQHVGLVCTEETKPFLHRPQRSLELHFRLPPPPLRPACSAIARMPPCVISSAR